MRRAAALTAALLLAGCVTPPDVGSAPEAAVTFDALRVETDDGPIVIVLYPDAAPETVALYLAYAREGYFDGREFNRIVENFVIQIIDRAGGATEDARRVPLETTPDHHFTAGAVGIARAADPNSGGPEWFIMDWPVSRLDGNYTVFGQVVEGLDVVHRAARGEYVDISPLGATPLGDYLTDRQARDPLVVSRLTAETVVMAATEAARYPLQLAPLLRDGDYRHGVEWPANLRAGAASEIGWFTAPYNGSAPLEAESTRVRIGDAELPVEDEADAPGSFRFEWTPPAAGRWNATLVADGRAMVTVPIDVRA